MTLLKITIDYHRDNPIIQLSGIMRRASASWNGYETEAPIFVAIRETQTPGLALSRGMA